ncbi:TIGR04282 family arsenosugar biosynthesis glycosyltransferase [Psychrobacter sp. 72-O-c]|uniref:TIGR04282 family arsenosugar biosynthesis glycosyltransferase n=1 Tax=Psychrobacter sp. 72-O-c TaxID=2774125 RepID=UPI0019196A76|nr:TIGR04282 family arsenosugar biosynthesis glycosyltransferase [Psychrobacter sp. 72-O-c]
MVKQLVARTAHTGQQTIITDICKKNICIIIFAKYPAQGMAKTRLIPALGIEGAAQIAQHLLLHSVEQAVATDYVVELCVSPVPTDPCWQVLYLPDTLQWSAQTDGDLGARLLTASQQALGKYKKIALIGTDCPSLTAQRIQVAMQQLDQYDAVMIPASDGGYVLLGFKQVHESLFSNMTWSVDSVAAATQQRIAALGWTLAILDPLHDIDEPADLKHLPIGWHNSDVNDDATTDEYLQ